MFVPVHVRVAQARSLEAAVVCHWAPPRWHWIHSLALWMGRWPGLSPFLLDVARRLLSDPTARKKAIAPRIDRLGFGRRIDDCASNLFRHQARPSRDGPIAAPWAVVAQAPSTASGTWPRDLQCPPRHGEWLPRGTKGQTLTHDDSDSRGGSSSGASRSSDEQTGRSRALLGPTAIEPTVFRVDDSEGPLASHGQRPREQGDGSTPRVGWPSPTTSPSSSGHGSSSSSS